MKVKKFFQFILSVLFTETVGLLSGLFAGNIADKYAQMNKPPFSPPGFVFGIVWAFLYFLLGCVFYMILQDSSKQRRKINILVFLVQLLLNFLWSIIFFGGNKLWFAVIIILALDVLVFFCISLYKKVNKLASRLLLPYFIWILFATYLNIAFAWIN